MRCGDDEHLVTKVVGRKVDFRDEVQLSFIWTPRGGFGEYIIHMTRTELAEFARQIQYFVDQHQPLKPAETPPTYSMV